MSAFTGTMALVRLALRRDRLRLTLWITGLAAITAITVDSLQSLYPTREALAAYANTISGNVAVIAMSGPDRALDTLGGRAAFEIWQYCAAIALMAVFAVTRGARAEEESGRSELVRAAAVGRHAHSAAAITVATLACVAVGVLIAGALWALGLPLGGSATLGAGFASIGVGFAAVSLVANQLTAHARAANGIAGAAVAVGYVLRAVGDTSMPALSWLSPFGWAQAMHPFSGNRWWPLALCLAVSAALVVLALALEERRDLGAGILPDRAGPATAGVLLGSPIGLAWRLQRASILAWVVGSVMLALIMGTMVDDADDLVGDNEALRQYLAQLGGASLAEIFLATLLGYFALAAVGFALQSVVRLRTEELKGRAELVLALGVSRRRWLATQLAVTVGRRGADTGAFRRGAGRLLRNDGVGSGTDLEDGPGWPRLRPGRVCRGGHRRSRVWPAEPRRRARMGRARLRNCRVPSRASPEHAELGAGPFAAAPPLGRSHGGAVDRIDGRAGGDRGGDAGGWACWVGSARRRMIGTPCHYGER